MSKFSDAIKRWMSDWADQFDQSWDDEKLQAFVGQRVEVGPEMRLACPFQARHVAIEHVAQERRRQQDERRPEKPPFAGGQVVQAEKDGDGAARGVADGEGIRHRV